MKGESSLRQDLDDLDSDSDNEGNKGEIDTFMQNIETDIINFKRFGQYKDEVTKVKDLSISAKFQTTVQKVRTFQIDNFTDKNVLYELVMYTNSLNFEIDKKLYDIYRVIVDHFKESFQELSSIVKDNLQYIKAVKVLIHTKDTSQLENIIPQAAIMAIALTTSSKKEISDEKMTFLTACCEEYLSLEAEKRTVLLPFVSEKVANIAPNVCVLVGSEITAKLLGLAGSLENLSKIPSGNIKLLGKADQIMIGFSKVNAVRNTGIIYNSILVQDTEPQFRKKTMNILAGRLALCARLDYNRKNSRQANNTDQANEWLEEIEKKIKKWATPNPGKSLRALPNPEPKQRTKRGGRRIRKRKERLAQTEMHRQLNRVSFGETGDEYGESAMGNELGMLGDSSKLKNNKFGKLRVLTKKKNNQKQTKKEKKLQEKDIVSRYKERLKGVSASIGGSITSGTSTSVTLTPFQGMELVNPNLNRKKKVDEANNKWFKTNASFDTKKLVQKTTEEQKTKRARLV